MGGTATYFEHLSGRRSSFTPPEKRAGDERAVLEPGTLIAGRFRVTGLLGQGGMGTVYAATELRSGRSLAVKRTLSSASPKVLEQFKREFHVLRGLRHPNIIEVYEYGLDHDAQFYTMELLEGSDLGRAAPLPWRRVCSYLRQLAAPLALLHARHLLHRDISPRNVWSFPDGRVKLIDFGALTPFGIPNYVVGTLPLLAPEWLSESPTRVVDQRADLYSLGALAYWLLTGTYAYGAITEADVPQCWARTPRSPSAIAALLKDGTLESIPPELDGLILALLRTESQARPETIERVIDRLDAIAGARADPIDHAMRGCLRSQALVGRDATLQYFENWLEATHPDTCALVIGADPGMGCTRLLEELSVVGSLSGAITLLVRADNREKAYGAATAIVRELFEHARPEALAAARAHGHLFAGLLPELECELRVSTSCPAPQTVLVRSQHLPEALTQWLQTLADKRRIIILVDDVQCADEESVAWLAILARKLRGGEVRLVVGSHRAPNAQSSLPIQLLYRAAHSISLAGLNPSEVEGLLRSVFGPVAYLGRVSALVHRLSQGVPSHCIELLEYLIEHDIVTYIDGTWTLPGQLLESDLPFRRHDLQVARMQAVSAQARGLAEVLSVDAGEIALTHCAELSELTASDTPTALVELVLAGVLTQSPCGYRFRYPAAREHALATLPPKRRKRAHRRLGEALLRDSSDPVDRLRAGLHLLRAGEPRRCQRLVWEAVWRMLQSYEAQTRLSAAVPLLEELVALQRRTEARPQHLTAPLIGLAVASYSTDSRLAQRYGSDALATLERLLCMKSARWLRRYLGPKLALYAALILAMFTRRRSISGLIYLFVTTDSALHGVAASSFDHGMIAECARVLEPLEVLGDRNIAGLLCRSTRAVAAVLTEHHATTLVELRAVVARIESVPMRHAPESYREDIADGMLFPVGLMECWRMNPEVLAIADRIAASSSLNARGADHLRAVYYSMRGERTRAEMYRRRVELTALQTGTAWQVVTVGPLDDHFTSLWTHDALLAKHAAAELERLSRQLPTLQHEARRARATYLVLCGRYREALELMAGDPSPPDVLGWTRGQGVLARAHNRLGEHARARELCESALAARSEADLEFVVMNLNVQLELALAQAAEGDYELACAQTDRLLMKHASTGPLVLGAIHETCARASLLAGELERAQTSWLAMQACYATTQSAVLLELSNQLGEQISAAQRAKHEPERAIDRHAALGDDIELVTRTHMSLGRGEMPWPERARRSLRLALEMTDAETGFVVSCDEGELIHLDSEAPDAAAVQWAKRLRSGNADQTADVMPGAVPAYTANYQSGERHYCMLSLGSRGSTLDPALLVLGFPRGKARLPEPIALDQLARSLRAMLAS